MLWDRFEAAFGLWILLKFIVHILLCVSYCLDERENTRSHSSSVATTSTITVSANHGLFIQYKSIRQKLRLFYRCLIPIAQCLHLENTEVCIGLFPGLQDQNRAYLAVCRGSVDESTNRNLHAKKSKQKKNRKKTKQPNNSNKSNKNERSSSTVRAVSAAAVFDDSALMDTDCWYRTCNITATNTNHTPTMGVVFDQ